MSNMYAEAKTWNPLPEPSPEDVRELVRLLTEAGIEIRYKDLRGWVKVPS